MRIVAVTSVRNEAPFLLEWVAYNRLIGFTDIVIFYNNCTDGTEELLRALQSANYVTAIRNRGMRDLPPQVSAFVQARSLPVVRDADWATAIDVDEFINILPGNGLLSDLFSAIPLADTIMIQMRHFGSSDHIFLNDDFVISQFTRASLEEQADNQIVKTLHRMGNRFRYVGLHMPFFRQSYRFPPRIFNGSGQEVPAEAHKFERNRKIPEGYSGMSLVRLNHYAVRSLDQYLVKRRRGACSGMRDRFNKHYWRQREANEVEDTSILRHLPRLKAETQSMLQDAGIADAVRRARKLNQLEVMLAIRDAPPFAYEVARTKSEFKGNWNALRKVFTPPRPNR